MRFRLIGRLLACTALAAPANARDTAGPDRNQVKTAPNASPAAPETTSAPAAAPAPQRKLDAPTNDATNPLAPRAKQLYALGAEAFTAQRHADAIRYFQRAAELVPSSKLTYNIALAYDEMRDGGRALAHYRAYLKSDADESSGELRRQVAARVAELEASLAESGVQQLTVTSDPPGATLQVAGRVVGTTPWTGELTPGLHPVTLTLRNHQAERMDAAVSLGGASDLHVTLKPDPAPELKTAPSPTVRALTWTFLGVGSAALAGGIAFEISRVDSSDAERNAGSSVEAAEARGSADAKQMASLVLLGFGGGFLIGGGILLALDLTAPATNEPAPVEVGLPCVPGFCGVTARGAF